MPETINDELSDLIVCSTCGVDLVKGEEIYCFHCEVRMANVPLKLINTEDIGRRLHKVLNDLISMWGLNDMSKINVIVEEVRKVLKEVKEA